MKLTNYNCFMRDFLRDGPDSAAAHAAALGFDSVEFLDFCLVRPPALPDIYPAADVKKALDAHGISTACFSVYADPLHSECAAYEAELRREIAYAAALGSPYFHHTLIPRLTLPPDAPSYEEVFDTVVREETKVAGLCAAYGMGCLYEPQGMYFNGEAGISRLIETLRKDCPNVGFCADVGNPLFVDESAAPAFARLAATVCHVHVKDYTLSACPSDKKPAGRSRGGKWIYDADIGTGDADIRACLGILKQSGYDGHISLEISGDDETLLRAAETVRKIWEETGSISRSI